MVRFESIEYPGRHGPLISEASFAAVQRIREARQQSKEKPSVHTHYLKGSIYCGECGEPLSLEVSRNRAGTAYSYFYCLGRQAYKNGCGFRATQVHVVEDLVEDHWGTATLSDVRLHEIRHAVFEHIELVLPREIAERQQAETRLARLS